MKQPRLEHAEIRTAQHYWQVFLVNSGESLRLFNTLEQASHFKDGYNRAVERARARFEEYLEFLNQPREKESS